MKLLQNIWSIFLNYLILVLITAETNPLHWHFFVRLIAIIMLLIAVVNTKELDKIVNKKDK